MSMETDHCTKGAAGFEDWAWLSFIGGLSSHYFGSVKGFKLGIIMFFADSWVPLYLLKRQRSPLLFMQLGLSSSY